MTGVDAMEVELEDSQVLLNSPDLNRARNQQQTQMRTMPVSFEKHSLHIDVKINQQLYLLSSNEFFGVDIRKRELFCSISQKWNWYSSRQR